MVVKKDSRAYPKTDAMILMFGILATGTELSKERYIHATGASLRSFHRYLAECKKWLIRFYPHKELAIYRDGSDSLYALFDKGSNYKHADPPLFKHYGQMSWGMKNTDGL